MKINQPITSCKRQSMSMLITLTAIILLGSSPNTRAQGWTTNGNNVTTSNNVGIGTSSPNRLLHILDTGSNPVFTGARVSTAIDGSDPVYEMLHEPANSGFRWRLGNAAVSNLYLDYTVNGFSGWATYVSVLNNGNVGIGTATPSASYKLDVNGAINSSSNINATGTITGGNIVIRYQDVAEWVPSSEQLSTGTVVVLDSTKSNQVIASTVSYDTRVAGVISEQPGIALGERGANKVLVATTGRVKVKVDATRAPIQVGDLLVTSDLAGVAMKSEPVNLGGVQIHRPGTLIGKALEPLERGSGTILVLLSLQ